MKVDQTLQKDEKPVLVVDLDQTLCRTDSMHEAMIQFAVARPTKTPILAQRLLRGKTGFKEFLAGQISLDPASLVYNDDVLKMVETARKEGQRVALVSASDHRVVEAVAEHLGVFDEYEGTGKAGSQNLGGQAKADYLVSRYGQGGFDYVGDSAKDIPVWKAARRAVSVNSSNALVKKAGRAGVALELVEKQTSTAPLLKPYFKALRPHQWSKNVLVFLPMLAAQDYSVFTLAFLAFVLFSLMASSVYILNDLVDLPSDRAHPRKNKRPFAAGDIPISHGVILALLLIVGSLTLAVLWLPSAFLAVLVFYFFATFTYSIFLKRKLIVDVITLAGLYTLRIIAGATAVAIIPSPWLLTFALFLFYSLAAIKRQGELVDQTNSGKTASPGRAYLSSDIIVMQIIAICAGQAAVLVFALYIYSSSVSGLYTRPEFLWLICPLLLYWLSRIAVLTHRGYMDDDPIVFAARDKISYITFFVLVGVLVAAEF